MCTLAVLHEMFGVVGLLVLYANKFHLVLRQIHNMGLEVAATAAAVTAKSQCCIVAVALDVSCDARMCELVLIQTQAYSQFN